MQIPNPVRTMPPDSGPSTTTTAQELQNTNNIPMQPAAAIGPTMPGQADSTDQIKNRVLISRSVQTTPSSTKPPIHYNNTKTAESQQPTSAADISHLADAAWQPKSADWIANRTPIPDPVRATHPDSRPSTRPIPSKPQNTNTPPAHPTAAAIPTTTTQPKSVSQIANHTPIPNPVHDHAARHRITCNGSTMKPQNTNTPPARQTSAT